MERSEIRECLADVEIPDCATLHPGYGPAAMETPRALTFPQTAPQMLAS
jgi:hypothetical protein